MASQFPPKKNTAFTLYFTLYKNDGTIIANPGTITKKVSIDGGDVADIAANVTEENTTYGQCSLVIAAGEMNGDAIWIYIKDDTSGCVPFTCTLYTAANLMDAIITDTTEILTRIPDATAGAAGGLPIVAAGGAKLASTVDLTAGQSIDCSDKTGFSLSATGADLILKSSTFVQAIVSAINELATYGLTALNTLLVTTGIKTATTAAPTDMAKESTLADIETKIDDTFDDVGDVRTTVDAILLDTGTTLDGKINTIDGIVDAILEDTGTTLPATLAAMTTAISGGAAAVWNYLTTALTTAGSIGKWFADWFAETPAGATSLGASDLVLVNNALSLLGHDTLSNLTGTDKVTTLCLQFYQQTLDNVLRAYTWNCAMTRSAALTAGTTPAFGYSYSFALPSGCLRVIRMSEKEYVFKVEGANLLTDESTAQILYIARIAPTAMDTLAKEAISARLASLLAFPLTNSNKVADDMWKMYLAKLDEAQNIDAMEGTADSLDADNWINTRA